MIYTNKEKMVAKKFIACKIPECIKWNELDFIYDSMECYEALFYFAYCILDNVSIEIVDSNLLKIIADGAFLQFIVDMSKKNQNIEFCDVTIELFGIMKRYKLL